MLVPPNPCETLFISFFIFSSFFFLFHPNNASLCQIPMQAIHKVTCTPHPNPGSEATLVRRCFRDASPIQGEVTLNDFTKWVYKQADIMDYLNQYIRARFVCALQNELKSVVLEAQKLFKSMADENFNTISKEEFRSVLHSAGYPPTEKEFAKVISILKENGGFAENGKGEGITEDAFRAMVTPWLSLSILDLDNSGTIDLGELKCLLWIHQDDGTAAPKDETVRKTMVVLDLDFSGEIDRIEWVEHNAECDIHTGLMVPSKLTRTFLSKVDEVYDKNKVILMTKLRSHITSQATEAVKFPMQSISKEKDREQVKMIIKDIAVEVVCDLDPKNLGSVPAQKVHDYREKLEFKIRKLIKFAMMLAKIEVKENMLDHNIKLDFKAMDEAKATV